MRARLTAQKTGGRNSVAKRLPVNEELLRTAFELAGIGIGLLDTRGRFVEVNRHLAEILGMGREELTGMNVSDLSVPEHDAPAEIPDAVELAGDAQPAVFEKRFVTGMGSVVWVEFSCAQVRDKSGKSAGFIASFHDITDRKILQIALEQQASLDPLTRALNRVRFEERATIELLRSGRHGYKMSMVMVDLDRFKSINDTLGHAAGDAALKAFGDIARSCLRATDLFGRWGGEEFLLLLPDTGPAGARRVSERMRVTLEKFAFPSGARVTASMGVVGRRTGESFSALLDRADKAMYAAKQAGRNRVVANAADLRRESKMKTSRARYLDLHWENRYKSGEPGIDKEHRQLFESANRLLAASDAGEDTGKVMPLIDDLLAQVTEHFMHEEQVLKSKGFKEYEAHRQGHRKLLAQASDLAGRVRQKKATAGAFLGFVIHDVVARHIVQDDRKYFPYMKKPERAGGRKRRVAGRSAAA